MNESIGNIMSELHKKVRAHYMNSPEKPNVIIFVTDDFRHRLLYETGGMVDTQMEVDFNNSGGCQLAGYPVYTIIGESIKPYYVFIDEEVNNE
tara:strand:+ start:1013 stop:1291 length:279 start_codon:yes stop_codon:yes gene_type:complete